MESIAVFAGLLSALFWGISPVLSKRGLSYGGTPMLVVVVVVATGFVMLWGMHISVTGIGNINPGISPFGYAIFLVGGFVGTTLGRIGSYTGIDQVGASLNSAVVAVNPVFATILAFIFLNESLSLPHSIGIVIVIAGLILLSFSQSGDRSGWARRDLLIPLSAAAAYGAGGVIRRFGLIETSATPIQGAALNETAALVGLVSYVVVQRRSALQWPPLRAFLYFVATGIFAGLGLLALFVGLENGPVALVTVLSGLSPLVSGTLSYFLLSDLEHVNRRLFLSATMIIIGVALITLA